MARVADEGAGSRATSGEPRIVVGMGGSNLVIRATRQIDQADTTTLADVANAAANAETTVVIDPEPTGCDDVFAAYETSPSSDRTCCTMCVGCSAPRSSRAVWSGSVANGRRG